MNWIERFIARRSRGKGLTVTLEPNGFVTEVRTLGGVSARPTDTLALQEQQRRSELVFACIDVKATAAQDPRLVVQRQVRRRGGKVEWEEIPGHPMRGLMMRPNPQMTDADLMRAAFVSWDVSNPRRFFAEKEYRGGLLAALHPLNPGQMEPIMSRDRRELIGYAWSDGATRREYALDELLIRRAPAWYNPPPLVAAMGATESDTAQTDYVRAFFANGGVPPGLLKYSVPLNDAKRQEIRDKWRDIYGARYGRQHDIGVLDSNAEWQETGASLDKLQSQTLRSVAESRICMVFGVPPLIVYAYVGLLRATYSNLKEAWAGFWDATMSPAFREWRLFWQWELLSEFEDEADIRAERVRLHYDMSQVSALQEDVDATQGRARANYGAGGISLNEFRSAIGAPPLVGADELYRAAPLTTLAQMLAPTPAAPEPPIAPGKAAKALGDPGVQLLERRMERAVTDYLTGEYRRAAENVSATA